MARSRPGMALTAAVDYNSWIESDKGLRLAQHLDKNVILAEGQATMRALARAS